LWRDIVPPQSQNRKEKCLKNSLDLQWEQEHLKEGRYTLDMVKIDRKVREVISQIKLAEAEKADVENKIEAAAPQVSVAT
jgi:hypothetical protein